MNRPIKPLLIAALCVTFPAVSQVQVAATLSGSVVDASGALVPGVEIAVTNSDTSLQRKSSAHAGYFSIPLLPPGRYSVTARRDKFAPVEIPDVILNVGEVVNLRIELKIGQTTETVTVRGQDLVVQSQSGEISALVDQRRVRELPLNGKDFQKLLALTPGAGALGVSSSGTVVISGARTTFNNYAIDGVTANDERVDGLAPGGGFTAVGNAVPNIVSTEAIQEFRVIASNADASFGRGSGGQISLVTKSGTNALHGSAYEFLRNDRLDARDFFNTGPFLDSQGHAKTPPFHQNLYGAGLGGPIRKNRHFFFGNYEGFRQRREITSSIVAPNADLISLIPGDLGKLYRAFYIDGGIIPASGNPAGIAAPLTAANRTAAINAGFRPTLFDGDFSNGEAATVALSGSQASNLDQNTLLLRTDHHLTDRLSASLRYGYAGNTLLGGIQSDRVKERKAWHSGTAQFQYAASTSQMFELRLAVQRAENRASGGASEDPKLQAVGVTAAKGIFISPDTTGLRFIRVRASIFSLNNSTTPQVTLSHTWTRGKLVLRSGVEIRRYQLNLASGLDLPQYSFTGFVGPVGIFGASPSQAQAAAATAATSVYGANGGPTTPLRGFRSTQQEYFIQADWRLHRDLTVNLGLRYGYFGVYSEVNGAFANLYATNNGQVVPDASPFALGRTANAVAPVADGRPLYQRDRNNFQPRLGAAWNLFGRDSTVLRGSFGIYNDRIIPLEFSLIVENAPYSISTAAANVPYIAGAPIPVNPQTATVYGIDPRIRNPYTARFNASVEQKIGAETSVTAAYVGARGRDLLRYTSPNAGATVPQALRPDPRFATERVVTNGTSSDYDALQVFARRRFSRGIDFTAAYTYARSTDDVSAAFAFSTDGQTLVNTGASSAAGFQGGGANGWAPRPYRADRGRSDFDITHNFTISHLIELPFGRGRHFGNRAPRAIQALLGGWSIAGIAILRSGTPFNATLGSDANDDGATDDRPALVSGSLDDLYGHGKLARTQFLVPQAQARTALTVSPNVTDPFSVIARNAFRAPSIRFYDLSLIKKFALSERVSLGVEANAFNVFNNALFAAPTASLSSSFFGLITATAAGTNPRQLQFGLRLAF
jgi:hypothetical protein